MSSMVGTAADVLDEALRLADLARNRHVPMHFIGGVAVRLQCPEMVHYPELVRAYADIDVAVSKSAAKAVRDLLSEAGYEADRQFNALHGASRLLFFDREHSRQVDVFLGVFAMCHKLDLERRVGGPGPTLSPSDLLLLKLQIVQLNHKDLTDALALLVQHDPAHEDTPDTLSLDYIARLCAGDWGWYTTLHDNLAIVVEQAPGILSDAAVGRRVQERGTRLLEALERVPKSLGWRMRDKIGRRKLWYELPEEVGT